ncbi:MAG TPA: DUF86 domain-containing protein [Chloroflexi bacterium]|nr:DUF86 domain-containing protein [Chloroflexota bacterium]
MIPSYHLNKPGQTRSGRSPDRARCGSVGRPATAPQLIEKIHTFVVLAEHGVLPDHFMPTLRQMVSFRNRVVHLYWDVDDIVVYRILQENLDDFETYIGYVLNFIQSDSGNPEPTKDS